MRRSLAFCLVAVTMCLAGCSDRPEDRAGAFLQAFSAGDYVAMRAFLRTQHHRATLDRWEDEAENIPGTEPFEYVRRRLFGSEQYRPQQLRIVRATKSAGEVHYQFEYQLPVPGRQRGTRTFWGALTLTGVDGDWYVYDFSYGHPAEGDLSSRSLSSGPEERAWAFLAGFRQGDLIGMKQLLSSPRLAMRLEGWLMGEESSAGGEDASRIRRHHLGQPRPGNLQLVSKQHAQGASVARVQFEYTLPAPDAPGGLQWHGGTLELSRIRGEWFVNDYQLGHKL